MNSSVVIIYPLFLAEYSFLPWTPHIICPFTFFKQERPMMPELDSILGRAHVDRAVTASRGAEGRRGRLANRVQGWLHLDCTH